MTRCAEGFLKHKVRQGQYATVKNDQWTYLYSRIQKKKSGVPEQPWGNFVCTIDICVIQAIPLCLPRSCSSAGGCRARILRHQRGAIGCRDKAWIRPLPQYG